MKSEFNLTVNKPKHNKTRSGNIVSDILEPHDRFAEDEANAVCRYLENPDVIDKAAVDLYEKTGELLDTYRPCYVSLVIRTGQDVINMAKGLSAATLAHKV